MPKPPTRTYRLFSGFGGSAFTFEEEFTSPPTVSLTCSDIAHELSRFLLHKPEIHDLSWSTDDGRTYVVKRKTSDISEVSKDTANAK